ncbi:hypothetical protein ACTXT7_002982 [Hymenolepis weldensis]
MRGGAYMLLLLLVKQHLSKSRAPMRLHAGACVRGWEEIRWGADRDCLTVDTPTLLARAVCANEEVSARGVMRALARRHACALTLLFLSVGFYSPPSHPRYWCLGSRFPFSSTDLFLSLAHFCEKMRSGGGTKDPPSVSKLEHFRSNDCLKKNVAL